MYRRPYNYTGAVFRCENNCFYCSTFGNSELKLAPFVASFVDHHVCLKFDYMYLKISIEYSSLLKYIQVIREIYHIQKAQVAGDLMIET